MAIDYFLHDSFRQTSKRQLFGYLRSEISGDSLESDRRSLIEKGVLPPRIFIESPSAGSPSQPELTSLQEHVKSGDIIIIPSLMHISTSIKKVLTFLEEMSYHSISIIILSIGKYQVDLRGNLSPTARIIYNTLKEAEGFQQHPRALINADKVTNKIGRPRVKLDENRLHAYDLIRGKNGEKPHSYKVAAELTGYSVSTLQRIVKTIEKP